MALGGERKPGHFHSDQGCKFASAVSGQAAWRGYQVQLVRPEALLRQHPSGEVVVNDRIRAGVSVCLKRWLGV